MSLRFQFHPSQEGKLPQYNTRVKLPQPQRDLVYDGKTLFLLHYLRLQGAILQYIVYRNKEFCFSFTTFSYLITVMLHKSTCHCRYKQQLSLSLLSCFRPCSLELLYGKMFYTTQFQP